MPYKFNRKSHKTTLNENNTVKTVPAIGCVYKNLTNNKIKTSNCNPGHHRAITSTPVHRYQVSTSLIGPRHSIWLLRFICNACIRRPIWVALGALTTRENAAPKRRHPWLHRFESLWIEQKRGTNVLIFCCAILFQNEILKQL